MSLKRISLLAFLPLVLVLGSLAGCNGEEKPDPDGAVSQLKQRGAPRPGGAPPGFPVRGETGTAPGTAPGVPPNAATNPR